MRINRGFLSKSLNKKFTQVFEKNLFHGEDSLSGEGSNHLQTKELAEGLPKLLKKFQIKSILDVPCGDFHWMQNVALDDIHYTGADIVDNMVAQLQMKYSSSKRTFVTFDLAEQIPPNIDAIFSRDLFVHLSTAEIRRALRNISVSNSKYFFTTTFTNNRKYRDLPLVSRGIAWRPINFQNAPFNFPKPLEILVENCTEANGAFSDKAIGVWKISDLPY